MSLLGQNVYANPATPLWLGTSGGTIEGNLIVDGTVTADTMVAPIYRVQDPSGNEVGVMNGTVAPNDGIFFKGDVFTFGKVGATSGNTTLVTSVAGANLDALNLGGSITAAIGPIPIQIITSTKTVNPVAQSPAAPSQFGVDTTITGIANAEYDVQVTGTVFVASGVPDVGDSVVYTFTSGGGQGSLTAVVYPGASGAALGNYGVSGAGPLTAGGAAATINMRARVVPNASGTTLGVSVREFPAGGSTAVYGATLTICDVQRVR